MGDGGEGILAELIFTVRHGSFVVQLLPSNPVFVLPTMATEVFHFIYLLFISLQLPKINAKHGSFFHSHTRFISQPLHFAVTLV